MNNEKAAASIDDNRVVEYKLYPVGNKSSSMTFPVHRNLLKDPYVWIAVSPAVVARKSVSAQLYIYIYIYINSSLVLIPR
jgi:hypothetical protein